VGEIREEEGGEVGGKYQGGVDESQKEGHITRGKISFI
jgi:hypothetical protein